MRNITKALYIATLLVNTNPTNAAQRTALLSDAPTYAFKYCNPSQALKVINGTEDISHTTKKQARINKKALGKYQKALDEVLQHPETLRLVQEAYEEPVKRYGKLEDLFVAFDPAICEGNCFNRTLIFTQIFSNCSVSKFADEFEKLAYHQKQFIVFSYILTRRRIENQYIFIKFKQRFGIKQKADQAKLIDIMRVSVSEQLAQMMAKEANTLNKLSPADKAILMGRLNAQYIPMQNRLTVPAKTLAPYPSIYTVTEALKQHAIPVIVELYRYIDPYLEIGSKLAKPHVVSLLYQSSVEGITYHKPLENYDKSYDPTMVIQMYSIQSDKQKLSEEIKYSELNKLDNFQAYIQHFTQYELSSVLLNLLADMQDINRNKVAKVTDTSASNYFKSSFNSSIKNTSYVHDHPSFYVHNPCSLGKAIPLDGSRAFVGSPANTIKRIKYFLGEK